jgi:hypothetical protein
MAKRKRAAALFEVIHADKRFPSRHGSGSTIASWWTRRSKGSSSIDESAPSGPSLLTRLFSCIPEIPRIGLQMDPERQEVRFHLSYTAAVLAIFTVVVGLALAFVIGRHGSNHTVPALAEQTTEELRAGPAQPEVLDVNNDSAPLALASEPTPRSTPPAAPKGVTTSPLASNQAMHPSAFSEPARPSTLMVSDSKRTVGLWYVVVQGYPPEEEKHAKAACDLLNQNGVLCTLEKKVALAASPTWICIVGVTGFDRIRNSPEFDAYVNKIQEIGAKGSGSSKFLKKFDPKAYKWRETK